MYVKISVLPLFLKLTLVLLSCETSKIDTVMNDWVTKFLILFFLLLQNEAAAHKIEQKSSSQLLPESMQLAQEYNNCSGNNGVISIEQNMMLHDSKVFIMSC